MLSRSGKFDSKAAQETMEETSSQSIVVAADRVFTGSTKLDGDAIGVWLWEWKEEGFVV